MSQLAKEPGAPAATKIWELLGDEDVAVSKALAKALEKLAKGHSESIAVLASRLKHADSSMRLQAIHVLQNLADRNNNHVVMELIVPLLQDSASKSPGFSLRTSCQTKIGAHSDGGLEPDFRGVQH